MYYVYVTYKPYPKNIVFSLKKVKRVWQMGPKGIPLAFFMKLAHFEHLYISWPIPTQSRMSLLVQVQNELLHLLKSLFNWSVMNILYKNYT
jgi:hypothetical protein